MMKSRSAYLLFLALGMGLSAIPQAQAFQKGEGCELKQTSDGFVALRKGPSVKSKLIHKLKPQYHRIFPDTRNSTWVHVFIGGYGDPDDEGVPMKERDVGEGYIKSNLISWASCAIAG